SLPPPPGPPAPSQPIRPAPGSPTLRSTNPTHRGRNRVPARLGPPHPPPRRRSNARPHSLPLLLPPHHPRTVRKSRPTIRPLPRLSSLQNYPPPRSLFLTPIPRLNSALLLINRAVRGFIHFFMRADRVGTTGSIPTATVG